MCCDVGVWVCVCVWVYVFTHWKLFGTSEKCQAMHIRKFTIAKVCILILYLWWAIVDISFFLRPLESYIKTLVKGSKCHCGIEPFRNPKRSVFKCQSSLFDWPQINHTRHAVAEGPLKMIWRWSLPRRTRIRESHSHAHVNSHTFIEHTYIYTHPTLYIKVLFTYIYIEKNIFFSITQMLSLHTQTHSRLLRDTHTNSQLYITAPILRSRSRFSRRNFHNFHGIAYISPAVLDPIIRQRSFSDSIYVCKPYEKTFFRGCCKEQ